MKSMTKLRIANACGPRVSAATIALALLISLWPAGRGSAADAPASGLRPGGGKPSLVRRPPIRLAAKPAAQNAAAEPGGSASDLDSQLLEGTGPVKPPASKPPAATPPAGKPAAPQGAAPEATQQAPPPAEHSMSEENPLARIAEQMQTVQRRLEALKASDAETSELQGQIVAEMTELIKQLEKQQSSQQSASSQQKAPSSAKERQTVRQPSADPKNGKADDRRPAKESNERTGKGERVPPTTDELRGLMKDVWGQLPAREREQMLQSPPEQFLPKYELLLEKYYKRLAEEQKHRP
jgi:TolA-binding protein